MHDELKTFKITKKIYHVNNIKVFAKNEKRIEDFDTNTKNLTASKIRRKYNQNQNEDREMERKITVCRVQAAN